MSSYKGIEMNLRLPKLGSPRLIDCCKALNI